MNVVVALAGVLLIFIMLWDAFETMILPRRVTRQIRLTRYVFRYTWRLWSSVARRLHGARRDAFLSIYGPLALPFLLATWAVGLIVGFALLQWAFGSALTDPLGKAGFGSDLYVSGTTLVTLGLGDVAPRQPPSRFVTVLEAGTGFAFLALVIAYLPVLYQSFSRREVTISLLDARAGSPPSGVELLRRHGEAGRVAELVSFLQEWEHWAAELLESHLSYPSLAYFRSQHDNQSWLAALTSILDACALVLAGLDDVPTWPAQLTFAMARHASVDLSQVLMVGPRPPVSDRLPPATLAEVRQILSAAGLPLHADPAAEARLSALRAMYEPYVYALAERLLMPLPGWLSRETASDSWQRTAWDSVHQDVRW